MQTPSLTLRFFAWVCNWELVWLIDGEEDTYLTKVHCKNSSVKTCSVYWGTGVGHVILNVNGTCGGSSSYIKRWMPYKKLEPVKKQTRYEILRQSKPKKSKFCSFCKWVRGAK